MTGRLDGADRADLADLVARYAAHVDGRALESAVELFTVDAELEFARVPWSAEPVVRRGRDAIARELARVRRLDATVHEIVGQVVDPDGADAATGRTACVAHHVSGTTDEVWHLHYDDRYRRTPRGWRFARRSLTVDLREMRAIEPLSGS